MAEFFYALIGLLLEMAPWLLFGFFVTGLLHVFIPRKFFQHFLAANNFSSVFWAAVFGVPLPLCSCGVIPTAMGLHKDGASRGAAVSFLISTPQTGVDSILATWALLGTPFAVIRPLAAFFTGLVGGTIVNHSFAQNLADETKDGSAAEPSAEIGTGTDTESGAETSTETSTKTSPGTLPETRSETSDESNLENLTFTEKVCEVFRYGFVEMMQDIGKWLTVGLLLAAAITVLVPDGAFAELASKPWLGMLAVLAISVPMYVCATGSIPIAAALMLKGFSPGAAFVLLMAGPATNLGALFIVTKVLGKKTASLYLAAILGGALLTGTCIDLFCDPAWFQIRPLDFSRESCCTPTAWGKICSAVLLVILLVNALLFQRGKGKRISDSKKGKTMNSTESKSVRTFRVTGMTCNHCRNFVEKSIKALDGVEEVTVLYPQGTAEVSGSVSDAEIIKAVEEAGFEIKPE